MENLDEIINQYDNIFYQIGPSKIHGIGLIAIVDIPKNTLVLENSTSENKYINYSELKKRNINSDTINTIKKYFAHDNNGIELPVNFNKYNMKLISYMNHSTNNNVNHIFKNNLTKYYSNKDIKKGEELTVNYLNNYCSSCVDFKEKEEKKINIIFIFVFVFIFIFYLKNKIIR